MFKSKKRLLMVLGTLAAVSGVAAAAVVIHYGDLFGDTAQPQASAAPAASSTNPGDAPPTTVPGDPIKPPASSSFAPSSSRFATSDTDRFGGESYGGEFGSPASPSTVSPASYPAPGEAPVVRANDDGSFRAATGAPTSPAHMSFSDGADGASSNGSSQRFLPAGSGPEPPSSPQLAPPTGLAPPANSSDGSTAVSPVGPPPSSGSLNGYDSEYGSSTYQAQPANPSASDRSPPSFGAAGTGVSSAPPARFGEDYAGASRMQPPGAFDGAGSRAMGVAASYVADVGGAAGEPGPKQLEGVQSPTLTIEKVAPGEVQVGKQANFLIKVRNAGQVDAEEVVVFDQTPRGTRYVGSTPEASRAPDGSLMWQLGTLKSGEESTITLQLVPLQEGQIGSVARVAFAAKASASTICTKPLLTVEHTGPSSVLIGESVNLTIVISNPGTGVATGVTLEEDVPDGLTHPAGNELEYEIGQLRPGESRKLELTLTAAKPGLISNLLLVRGDGNLVAEDRLELEVVAPQLDLALTGPSKRYLERQATYSVRVANPGTAAAKNIELVTYLPKGLKFVSTDNHGQYDAQNHAVYWSLEELPPRMTGDVTVTAVPIETGQQKIRVEGRGDLGLTAAYNQEVVVEGLAELFFQVADSADPIEVGSDTEYEIRLINQGSKTDTNVRVIAQLPADLKPVGGDGPTRAHVEGNNMVFEPLARLAPKDSAVFKVRVKGQAPGDQRIRVQVVSDEVKTPVTKEESTRVYSDQ